MRPVQFGSIQPIPRELTLGKSKARQMAIANREGQKLYAQPGVLDVQAISIPAGIVDTMNRLFEESGCYIDMNAILRETVQRFTQLPKAKQAPMQYFLLADDHLGPDKTKLADNVAEGNPFALYLIMRSWQVLDEIRDRSNCTPEQFETFH